MGSGLAIPLSGIIIPLSVIKYPPQYAGGKEILVPLSGIKAYISALGGSAPLSGTEYYGEQSYF